LQAAAISVAAEIHARTIVGDVAEPGFCNSAVAAVIDECGRVDIFINAAGVIVRAPAYETTDQQWRRIFAVNVEGMFYMCRAAILVLRTRNAGAIVNFGSIWGEGGSAGHAAYAATKGAVHQLAGWRKRCGRRAYPTPLGVPVTT
jgi:NAD(P)-dependent dehydrogenase (short-subunit alcohol dehydrogenase family)